jgi:phosphomannomutase
LDGTLAESKSSLDSEMAGLLHDLLGIVKVAVISGGGWPQFEKQLLSNLPHDKRLVNLSLLPTCGTKFYRYAGEWEKIYEEDFTPVERQKIVSSLTKALSAAGFKVEKIWERKLKTGEARLHSPLWVSRRLWKKKTNGTQTTPSARRSKRSLILLFQSFPSEWAVRHRLT